MQECEASGLYPWVTHGLTCVKGRGISWVRVQVDIWTPAGTPLLITSDAQVNHILKPHRSKSCLGPVHLTLASHMHDAAELNGPGESL